MTENCHNVTGVLYGRNRPGKTQMARTMRRKPTRAEAMLWYRLRGNRLAGFHFRRQQVIDDYIVDFYCSKPRIVVELDGESHVTTADYDRERDRVISQHGLKILRFSNVEMIRTPEKVLEEIKRVAIERLDKL